MWTNHFYTEFDTELLERRSAAGSRTAFQQDRDRLIYSSAFRRLQGKTQVFLAGEYDFYRTRLTHSIEVAQMGRAIARHLATTSSHLGPEFYIDSDLVEGICLAHDIGHPPFGHAGEQILHNLMVEHGGFEGNAQTLRIVTELIHSGGGERRGMKPTRAFLDGIMKYKRLFSESGQARRHFLYDEQRPYRGFVMGQAVGSDAEPASAVRSIECQIMDWADNTAYSLNDLLDGHKAGFISPSAIRDWGEEQSLDGAESALLEEVAEGLARGGNVDRFVAAKIGEFIAAASLEPAEPPSGLLTNRYRYRLVIDEAVERAYRLYSNVARDIVFLSPQIHQLEYKGGVILTRIFEAFVEEYVTRPTPSYNLLPRRTAQAVAAAADESTKMRLICDHIAGMTDGFATRSYKRLFDPDFGSFVDLI